MNTYRTADGDVLDRICYNHYGQTADVTERVLKHNKQLLAYGTHLPAGLIIELPVYDLQETQSEESINLWD